jgi:hypothetical protein
MIIFRGEKGRGRERANGVFTPQQALRAALIQQHLAFFATMHCEATGADSVHVPRWIRELAQQSSLEHVYRNKDIRVIADAVTAHHIVTQREKPIHTTANGLLIAEFAHSALNELETRWYPDVQGRELTPNFLIVCAAIYAEHLPQHHFNYLLSTKDIDHHTGLVDFTGIAENLRGFDVSTRLTEAQLHLTDGISATIIFNALNNASRSRQYGDLTQMIPWNSEQSFTNRRDIEMFTL